MEEFKDMFGFGNFLRSAEMEYVSIIMQEHLAHDCFEQLGRLGKAEFVDLNGDLTAFKRFYTPMIKRCDDIDKKLKFFEDEMRFHGIPVNTLSEDEFALWKAQQVEAVQREHAGMSLLDYWESIVNERYRDYHQIKIERDRTASNLYHAIQRRLVIEHASQFFAIERERANSYGSSTGLLESPELTASNAEAGNAVREDPDGLQFKHVAGILNTEDKYRFSKIIFRASFGQAVLRFADIPCEIYSDKGEKLNQSVFAVFYRGRTLTSKLERICTAFSAQVHDIPDFSHEREVRSALEETILAINAGTTWMEQERRTSGTTLAHLSILINRWRMGVLREKAIFHAMNRCVRVPERGSLEVQGWVLKSSIHEVRELIQNVHVAATNGSRALPYYFEVIRDGKLPSPPTHIETNKVTKAFQSFVSTYGVPRYREINPALWCVVSFPFLFGVMYGDIGHATLLTLAAGWIVWNEKSLSKVSNEMFTMVYGGRYMIFFMGLFSIYCGFIYNDVFSIGTNLFKTAWHFEPGSKVATWDKRASSVYPFGIDPEWHLAENDLLFFNSLKMKFAVVIGIIQMIFGLIMKVFNARFFNNKIDLIYEAIPQIIFMISLFGYMVFLIFYKWSIDWSSPNAPGAPPSLIDTMINIALKPGTVNDAMFSGQAELQTFILLIVFITVPLMLFVKPYLLSKQHTANTPIPLHATEVEGSQLLAPSTHSDADFVGLSVADFEAVPDPSALGDTSSHSSNSVVFEGSSAAADPFAATGAIHVSNQPLTSPPPASAVAHAAPPADHDDEDHGHHSFGELFIHQAIETIEFVLGSVSNTASYLRLWALSLAHSQLATVFWERALVASIEMDSPVFVFVGFAVFFGISVGVLLCMDVLECYLHALRLHWVEFQNKFYKADGHKFAPFSFSAISDADA